jgi:hypothetical protein
VSTESCVCVCVYAVSPFPSNFPFLCKQTYKSESKAKLIGNYSWVVKGVRFVEGATAISRDDNLIAIGGGDWRDDYAVVQIIEINRDHNTARILALTRDLVVSALAMVFSQCGKFIFIGTVSTESVCRVVLVRKYLPI